MYLQFVNRTTMIWGEAPTTSVSTEAGYVWSSEGAFFFLTKPGKPGRLKIPIHNVVAEADKEWKAPVDELLARLGATDSVMPDAPPTLAKTHWKTREKAERDARK